MPARLSLAMGNTAGATVDGGGTNYVVQTPTGDIYFVYIDSSIDVVFRKSTDGGITWSPPVSIFQGSCTVVSVWYDRWSGIAAGLIHVAYAESATDDTFYRTINTESSDALSTQTVIFAGGSTAGSGHCSIARARGGNVYCKVNIDGNAEQGFFRLPNANVPNGAWDAARTADEAVAVNDKMILLPGFAADNQDMLAIFWDTSANEVSRKIYDDSANTWAETSIATSMVGPNAAVNWPPFAAAVDLTNSRIVLIAWDATDGANADLLGWTVTESAITAFTTPVVSNGTDDQGLAAIGLGDTDTTWIAVYVGKSDGSETFFTSVNLYCKVSKDAGATWGPETALTDEPFDIANIQTVMRFTGRLPPVVLIREGPPMEYHCNVDATRARTRAFYN